MDSLIATLPDDIVVRHILSKLLVGTFDEVTVQVGALRLVSKHWNNVMQNHPEWTRRFVALQQNLHYAARAAIYGIRVLGNLLECNPKSDNDMEYSLHLFEGATNGGNATDEDR